MARKLTIALIVLLGLLTLGSSRPTFEDDESFAFDEEEARVYDDESFAFDEEEARVYDDEAAQVYDEEESRAYDEALAEFMSQYEEIRQNEEGPPRLLQSSNFCYGRKDGNYADFSNPRAFYMCDKAGQTWTMNCQTGLVFDQARNRCEWASGSSGNQQNTYDHQSYVAIPAKGAYVPQQKVQEIYVPQQPIQQTYVPQKAPVQITGYGR